LSESTTCPNCGKELFAEDACPACGTPVQKPAQDVPVTSPPPADAGRMPGISRKYVWAGIAAAAIVILLVVSIGVNQYAVDSLQFRGNSAQELDFATMSADMKIDVCNPTDFTASFDRFTMLITYKDKEFATMAIEGGAVPPRQIAVMDGSMSIDAELIAGLFMDALASAFSGEEEPAFDENDMAVTTTVDSSALGFIPISSSKTFTMSEFQEMMEQRNSAGFSCA
jgi:hypothetical protein